MIVPDLLPPQARAARFARICEEAMRERRITGNAGIGTLAEKWQHQIIKRYLSEDPHDHEVRVPSARFVSDVRVGQEVFEVQTGAFCRMQKKIAWYLEQTNWSVTVVHPIPQNRWVSWINAETEEISPRRKSPRHGRAEDLLPELYGLLPYLGSPRLHFRLLMLEVQDFRLLSPHSRSPRKGGERFERIPLSLMEELLFSSPSDYIRFLPEDLPSPFTVREFSAHTRIRGRDAYSAVRVLAALGLLSPAPPKARAMAFSVSPEWVRGR